jgi:multiple sugar transport system ATP-binding protein
MAEVRLVNVSKVYDGGVRAVDSVDVVVPDQSFTVLVGPSGCGKSTLLRMIAGLEEISEGELSIDGRVVNEVPPRDRDIAMVFQNYALYPHMTVYDNMGFSLKLRGASKGELDERVREAAAMLGLEPYLERLPKALSGGQRQRVAVGRAIVRKPKVFLFDEPLSNLDAKMRVQTRAELVRLHRRLKATMIYVTHDQAEAMTMGDQIVVLRDGRVQQIAAPIEVYNNPGNAFVAGFIGSPPMNFLPARLVGDAGAPRLSFDDAGGGRSVLVGVRPEDVRPDPPMDGVPSVAITGSVESVEMMGSEQYISVRSDERTIVARVEADVPVEIDERRTLHLNLGKARLFDPETEAAIRM